MRMNKELRVSPVQANLYWEDAGRNKKHLEDLFQQYIEMGGSDLILLPEMFSTGFSMNPKALAETMEGPTMDWMHQQSVKYGAAVSGSIIIEENKQYFNRLIWMQPDGKYFFYSKRHLFRMANEHNHYAGGNEKLIVGWRGWNICPLICYDLRFPVWSRNNFEAASRYDLLMYVANWPEQRSLQWNALLPARAIENQAFTIGLNRVGNDGKGFEYSGDSVVYDFKGETLFRFDPYKEFIATTVLRMDDLVDFRTKFNVGLDADGFQLLV